MIDISAENKKIILYHGSKSGLNGDISPLSREQCDFDRGFYMGTQKDQPLTLICNYEKSRLYTLSVDLTGLRVLDIDVSIEWALIIAFNRHKMESVNGTAIYEKYKNFLNCYDMVVGYIADDRMFVVLDRFFNGDISDMALIESLSVLKLGKQYVAITQKACSQIKIIKEEELTQKSRSELKIISQKNRVESISMANEICRKHRRDGRFFDEILSEVATL